MIRGNYIIFDFETGSRDAQTTEPIELAAIVVDGSSLEVIPGAEFVSLIRPEDMSKVEDGALRVNKKTREQIAVAPIRSVVWTQFCEFVKQYKVRGCKGWEWLPIRVGHNIVNFDNIILDRLNKEFKSGFLFHPIYQHDTLHMVLNWFSGLEEPTSYSMDSLRDFFGISKEGGHEALKDVYDTAAIFCRFMKMQRQIAAGKKFKGVFANG